MHPKEHLCLKNENEQETNAYALFESQVNIYKTMKETN